MEIAIDVFFNNLVDAEATTDEVIVALAATIGVVVDKAPEEDRPLLMSVVNTVLGNLQKKE